MKILLIGANGRMGKTVIDCCKEAKDAKVVLGVDVENGEYNGVKIVSKLNNVNLQFDVILDFSLNTALEENLKYAVTVKKPIVVASTNHNSKNLKLIDECKNHIPVLVAPNLSFGFNRFLNLIKNLKQFKDYDCYILEKHHKTKKDIPSGTAKKINEVLTSQGFNPTTFAMRGGAAVGEHEINLFGKHELIKITHTAENRKIYGMGAISACKFIFKKQKGLYLIDDVLR